MPLLHLGPTTPTRRSPRFPPLRAEGSTARRLDVHAVAAAALVNEQYLDPRFSVAGLAAEIRVAPLVLRLRFRRLYGLGLDEFLASRRLELAVILMESSPHRVGGLEALARASGYRDAAALDRDFERFRGTGALAAWLRRSSSRRSSTATADAAPRPSSSWS